MLDQSSTSRVPAIAACSDPPSRPILIASPSPSPLPSPLPPSPSPSPLHPRSIRLFPGDSGWSKFSIVSCHCGDSGTTSHTSAGHPASSTLYVDRICPRRICSETPSPAPPSPKRCSHSELSPSRVLAPGLPTPRVPGRAAAAASSASVLSARARAASLPSTHAS
eukprot:6179360-Pleurochrysis_carterae.AAC.1